jgi:DNA-binding HxlR family transcriptional regulator
MISELMGHKDYLRILLTLRKKGGLRFGQIESSLELNPAQVDRALKFLRKGSWINTHALPAEKGRGQTEYSLGKRGASFLEAFSAFTADIYRRKSELGPAGVAEFQDLYRQGEQTGGESDVGRIARVIKIGPLHHGEKETMADYRRGCLKLSPKERISEMRALSRRVILLNPKNPRSPHIERGEIRISHGAF